MRNEEMYTVHVSTNSNDYGQVGESHTLLGARRLARRFIRTACPRGEGSYSVRDENGETIEHGGRTLQSNHKWFAA